MIVKKAKIIMLLLVILCFMSIANMIEAKNQYIGVINNLSSPHSAVLKMDMNLTNADASFIGEAAFDYAGYSVAGVGDVNGDGKDDILIGAWGNAEGGGGAGQAYLILGKASGWAMDVNLTNANASFIGEAAGDAAGYSVAGVGDVNNDTYDDILIGAWGNAEGGSDAGQAYLILGKESGWAMDVNLANVNASFIGEAAGDYAGYSVAGAGDVNGDDYDDILIGAHLNSEGESSAGQAYLILGKASGWAMDTPLSNADASFIGEAAGDDAGESVAGAGDVNGDDYDDILVGALYNDEGGSDAGQAYLILGKESGWAMDVNLTNANASFIGEAAGDDAGESVAGAGDVNGDDYDDILIGALYNAEGGSYAGQAYLILGKASGWAMDVNLTNANASFIGEAAGDYAGSSVAGAGDVNGDDYDDILIGAHGNAEGGFGAGQAYLILGKASGWTMDTDLSTADVSFIGEHLDDEAGGSVAGAGDVNGDDYDDILIGAHGNAEGGIWAGQAYLILDSEFQQPSLLFLLLPTPTEAQIPSFPPMIFIPITLSSIFIGAIYLFGRRMRNIPT